MNCFVVGRQTGQFVVEMKSSVVQYKRSRHRFFTRVDIQIKVDGVLAQDIHRTSERESLGIVGTSAMFGWIFGNVTAEIMQVGSRWNDDCTGHQIREYEEHVISLLSCGPLLAVSCECKNASEIRSSKQAD